MITGGATGIGAATARRLAREGARVVINHLKDSGNAEAVVADIRAAGGDAVAVSADVRDHASLMDLRDRVHRTFGPVTVVVNNAGVISRSPCVAMSLEEWDRVVDTNLRGTFLCCKIFAPDMIERGHGRIVNIASDLALTGERLLTHYCAAKSGVLGLTRALAHELIEHGINVNAVAPGMTETPMLKANPTTYNEPTKAAIPARRWGRPEEIAATIAFLVSSDASYYVGWVLSPNGGVVM
nr:MULTISPECIES: 3-oxoacyl-ACP reductase family protein [unclassified Streptomyces]